MDRLRADKLQSGEASKKARPDTAPDIDPRGQQIHDPAVPQKDLHLFTRRNFLRGTGVLAAAGVVEAADSATGFSPIGKLLNDKIVGQYDYDADVKETKRILKEQYGIDLEMGQEKNQDTFTGNPVTLERYKITLNCVKDVLLQYPPEMLKSVGEGRGFVLRIVDKLHEKVRVENGTEYRVRRHGMAPRLQHGKPAPLILDAGVTPDNLRSIIHHELNHRFSMRFEQQDERDRRWNGFHTAVPHPHYQRQPGDVKDNDQPPERYFLNYHARQSPIEDQAVCAQWMMTPLLHFEFRYRIDNEEDKNVKAVLSAKYNQTVENYRVWSGGKIDNPFWEAIYREGEKEYVRMAKNA